MKNPIALITFLTISLFATTQAFSQSNPTSAAEASSFATIITPIEITKDVDLSFGDLIANSGGGTVVIDTDGNRTSADIGFPSTIGTVTAAAFTVTGFADATYSIVLPTTTTMTRLSGTETMTLSAFNHDAGGSPALDNTGNDGFNVGATLTVGANQVAGDYEGEFEVTVNYN